MTRRLACLAGLLALTIAPICTAQSSSVPAPPSAQSRPPVDQQKNKYLSQPYVIEKYITAIRFDNDGTGERQITARIRVQSETGAQQLSQLSFTYNAAREQIDFHYLHIRKPNGTQTDVGANAVKESVAPVVRNASAYAAFKQKQITVPPLRPGDTLEYQVAIHLLHPLASDHYWTQYQFLQDAVVLDEQLEINLPQGRPAKLASAGFLYSTDVASTKGRVIYRWKHSNLSVAASGQPKSADSRLKPKADIQLTSFATWDEVSRWYAKLEGGSFTPTPEIRAKTAELIQGRSNDLEKIQALYDYVTRSIHYLDLPLDSVGYEPHPASEVFRNQYGDAVGKQALLAAMLQAAGVRSNSALLPVSRNMDSSMPSPAQFDHVITAVARGNELIWMDSSAEVAPFRFLAAPLRKKSALLISPDGSNKIVLTPADPPFPSQQDVEIDGQISSIGKLTARLRYRLRGDNEFVLREAFYRTAKAQWKQLAQTLLTFDGVHGEVSDVQPSDPLETHNPFELQVNFSRPAFLDWSAKRTRVVMPMVAIGMPSSSSKPATVDLGSPLTVTAHLKLTLPAGFGVQAPVGVTLSRDYAEFKSSYHLDGQTLTAERSLYFKIRSLPSARASDYAAFAHAVEADQNQPLVVENSGNGAPTVPSADVSDLYEAGSSQLASGNVNAAIPLFERIVQLEPRYKDTWNNLGLSYFRLGQFDRAAGAFQKQLEIDPSDLHAHNYLGLALEQQKKFGEAEASFRKQIALNQLDPIAHSALGALYLSQSKYAEAVPELDKATVVSPEKADLQVNLGLAYLNLGQNEKATTAFEKGIQLSPTPVIWNNVAYNLAEHRIDIEKAAKYANQAVAATSANLRSIDLTNITSEQIVQTSAIGNYWDTLGWTYFQKGDLDAAERYVRSAWLLDQHSEMADHLAQIYEKRAQKDNAIHMYALALAAPRPNPDSRARLTLLLGGNSKIADLVTKAAPALTDLRTFPAGKLLGEDAKADFWIVFSHGDKQSAAGYAKSVRFVSGSEKLRPFADKLRSLDYGPMFPGTTPIQLVRRGTLSCIAATAQCSLILALPEEIHAFN